MGGDGVRGHERGWRKERKEGKSCNYTSIKNFK